MGCTEIFLSQSSAHASKEWHAFAEMNHRWGKNVMGGGGGLGGGGGRENKMFQCVWGIADNSRPVRLTALVLLSLLFFPSLCRFMLVVFFFWNFMKPSKTHFHLCLKPVLTRKIFQFTAFISFESRLCYSCGTMRYHMMSKIQLWQIADSLQHEVLRPECCDSQPGFMFVKTSCCNC